MPPKVTGNPNAYRQRGTTALEVAIFTIAGLVVATIATVTMLNVSFGVASSGGQTTGSSVDRAGNVLQLRPGVSAVRGEVDIDGDETIDLGGNDRRAVVKIEFVVTTAIGSVIDLTPPYLADGTGTDPDLSGAATTTNVRISTGAWQTSQAAWTVSIIGGNSDNFLEDGERAVITLWLHPYDQANDLYTLGSGGTDPWIDSEEELLIELGRFDVHVSVANGAGLEFQHHLPLELTPVLLLD